jgi:hypothetical protein
MTVMLCGLVGGHSKNGGNTFLCNLGNNLRNHTVLQPEDLDQHWNHLLMSDLVMLGKIQCFLIKTDN